MDTGKKVLVSSLILLGLGIVQTYTCVAMEQSSLGKISEELQAIRKNIKQYYPPQLVGQGEANINAAQTALLRAQKAETANDLNKLMTELKDVSQRVVRFQSGIKSEYRDQFYYLVVLVGNEVKKYARQLETTSNK